MCLIGCLIGALIGIILAPIMVIVVLSNAAKARKKARAIISGEVTAAPGEINQIIDTILYIKKSPGEEDRDLIGKLRAIKQDMEKR